MCGNMHLSLSVVYFFDHETIEYSILLMMGGGGRAVELLESYGLSFFMYLS